MSQQDPNEINRLIGEFMDLQERWEKDPDGFDWASLEALARNSAHAYNEGTGPSFHSLALDGVQHSEFHERFLGHALQAGFDPFRMVRSGSGSSDLPVIDHSDLAEAALSNPYSSRMRASLMELARSRFASLAQEVEKGALQYSAAGEFHVVEACAESIPLDLLEKIAPELAKSQREWPPGESVNPVEGYLSTAETIVDNTSKIYG
ncbi:hypothetical protein [Noviherbaspirillum massiliense]|uniref:hypothetical protein n=1 Tax=Noviherbaspirillum massiliense TaxID=1465823 RepID=UPI0011DDA4D8|nr:hypothetical protein [Noviherbaspirillum massiliense]